MSEYECIGVEVGKTIGNVRTAFVIAGVGSGVMVLQAGGVGIFY